MKPTFLQKNLPLLYLAGIFLGFSDPVDAQNVKGISESIQEFFVGETVYAQAKNEIQVTSKPSFWQKSGQQIYSIPLQLEYGFTDRLQIELKLPYHFLRPKIGQAEKGIGNTEVEFLYNILKGNKPFALSVTMGMELPTTRKEKGIERAAIEWEPSFIFARQIGKMQVHAGLAAEITKSESAVYYNLAAVLSLGVWRPTLELSGSIDEEKIVYLTPGLVWKGLDDFEFGVGVSKSISKNYREWATVLMITYEFSLK